MPDRFVPLSVQRGAPEVCDESHASPIVEAIAETAVGDAAPLLCEHVAGELALLRLAATEAFERAAAILLEELAREVLARELLLAPPAVGALVAAACDAFARYEPVALVLPAADVARVRTQLPVRADETLAPGDVVVEVRDGAMESRFELRVLATVERAVALASAR